MTTADILQALPRLKALVVGDICLDRWCRYEPAYTQPSRETGLPRTAVVETTVTPGAGGTIASNLVALGVGEVAIMGVLGDDGFGHELMQVLGQSRISPELCLRMPQTQTFTYTKLINRVTGQEDLPRVDWVADKPLPPEAEEQLCRNLRNYSSAFDVILVSDQAETQIGGVVTAALRQELSALARNCADCVVWVDSRERPEHFRHTIVKPNEAEAQAACQRLFGKTDYAALRQHTQAPLLVVTMGPQGALLVSESGERYCPTQPVEKPVDICGAGDSFSAGAATALAVTHSPEQAIHFGNLVASVTIMKPGTGTATPAEVAAAEAMQA